MTATGQPSPSWSGGWVADIGMGTVLVHAMRGELVISASRTQARSIPETLSAGASNPMQVPEADGLLLHLFDGSLIAFAGFRDVVDAERNGVSTGRIR